jgi:hypothetical protein
MLDMQKVAALVHLVADFAAVFRRVHWESLRGLVLLISEVCFRALAGPESRCVER